MKNKKIIIPIVLIIIILLAVLLICLISRKDPNTPNNNINIQPNNNTYSHVDVNVAEDVKKRDMDKLIQEVMDKSYKYYLLSSGNVKLDKNKTINKGLKKYYLVLLDGINSKEDIDKLIEDLFVNSFVSIKKEELYKDKDYITENGKLYLNIKSPLCSVSYDLTKMTYSYRVLNNLVYVAFSENGSRKFEFQIFNEDGKYKVSAPFYDCRFG